MSCTRNLLFWLPAAFQLGIAPGFPQLGWSWGATPKATVLRGKAVAFPLGLDKGLWVPLPQRGGLTMSTGQVDVGHSFGGVLPWGRR